MSWLSLEIQFRSWFNWSWSCNLLRIVDIGIGVCLWLYFYLFQWFLFLEKGFLLLQLFYPYLIQLFLPYLFSHLSSGLFLLYLLLHLVDNRSEHFIDSHLQSQLLLSDLDQVCLKFLDIDGLDFDLPVLKEFERVDVHFKVHLLLFHIDIEVREVIDYKVQYLEESACLYE